MELAVGGHHRQAAIKLLRAASLHELANLDVQVRHQQQPSHVEQEALVEFTLAGLGRDYATLLKLKYPAWQSAQSTSDGHKK